VIWLKASVRQQRDKSQVPKKGILKSLVQRIVFTHRIAIDSKVIYIHENKTMAARLAIWPSRNAYTPPVLGNRKHSLDLSVTSSVDNILGVGSRDSSSNVLAGEAAENAAVGAGHSARAAVGVSLAVAAKGALASSTTGGKDLAGETSLRGLLDVLESVALSDNLGTGVGLESVARVGIEVVADGVEERVTSNLGRATRGVVDVVALESDHVVAAGEVHAPVMVAVAGSRPGRSTVDLVVGDADTAGSAVTEHDVLAGNEVGGDVIDPDHVGYSCFD
jgi:hypothetical protein